MMRVAVPLSCVALALLAACAPPPVAPPPEPPGPTPEQLIASANELDDRFLAAFNARDAEAIAATYWNDPQVVQMPPDTPKVVGWEAIRANMTAMFAAMPPGTIEFTERHDLVVGDAVATWGTWKLTLTLPDGSTLMQQGRFSDVKAKRGAKWVYLMDHASLPAPMTGEAPAPAGASAPAASAPAGG